MRGLCICFMGMLFSFQRVQNNGTIYLHLYFVKAGNSPNPDDDNYSKKDTIYRSKRKVYSPSLIMNADLFTDLFTSNEYR